MCITNNLPNKLCINLSVNLVYNLILAMYPLTHIIADFT